MLCSALRHLDIHTPPTLLRQNFLKQLTILEVGGYVDGIGQVRLVEIKLFQQGREEGGGLEILKILPEEFATVGDAAPPDVKEIDSGLRTFLVKPEVIGVMLVGGGHLLALRQLENNALLSPSQEPTIERDILAKMMDFFGWSRRKT